MVDELLGLRANESFFDTLPGFNKHWDGLIDPLEACIWVGDFFIQDISYNSIQVVLKKVDIKQFV